MLKKLIVILLLGVHLFNVVGYKAFFQYFINSSEEQILLRLDNDRYAEAELSEIKVPLSLPYLNQSKTYERVNGEIVINGIHYNYVKRKILNDTLYLQCLPNIVKTKLFDAKNSYARESSDNTANGKNNTLKKAPVSSEYHQQLPDYTIEHPIAQVKPLFTRHLFSLIHTTPVIQAEPPEIS